MKVRVYEQLLRSLLLFVAFDLLNGWYLPLRSPRSGQGITGSRPFNILVLRVRATEDQPNAPFSSKTALLKLEEIHQKAVNALLISKEYNSPALQTKDIATSEQLANDVYEMIEAENDNNTLLDLYLSLLRSVSVRKLDSWQFSRFRSFARAIFERITGHLDSSDEAEIALVDRVNDLHLNFIDQNHHHLSTNLYQFAALLKGVYQDFGVLLNEVEVSGNDDYNDSIARWVAPLFARLKRRFPAFNSDSLEVELARAHTETLEQMCQKFAFETKSAFNFLLSTPVSTSFDSVGLQDLNNNHLIHGGSESSFPAWDLAKSFLAVIRVAIDPQDDPDMIETVVLKSIKDSILRKLQPISSDLQEAWNERSSYSLSESRHRHVLETALNIGQEVIAMIFVHWQLKHNILGAFNVTLDSYEREFLREITPQTFRDKSLLYGCIPSNLTIILEALIDNEFVEKEVLVNVATDIEGYSLMAQAIRIFATENYQSIILQSPPPPLSRPSTSERSKTPIFVSTSDAVESRRDYDAMYGAVLEHLFVSVLTSPLYQREAFLQLLLGAVALNIVMNVKEPRKAAIQAYERALCFTLEYLQREIVETALEGHSVDDKEQRSREMLLRLQSFHLPERLEEMESCLHYFLDVTSSPLLAPVVDLSPPSDSVRRRTDRQLRERMAALFELRFDAFQSFVLRLQTIYEQKFHTQTGVVSFLRRQSRPLLPLFFQREADIMAADRLLVELGLSQLQETLTNILSNVNLVLSLPEMGDVYREQLLRIGEELFSSASETETYLQQLIEQYFSTFYDVLVEQVTSKNLNRVESLVLNLCKLFDHPLIAREKSNSDHLINNSLNRFLSSASDPESLALPLIRVCEAYRSKLGRQLQKIGREKQTQQLSGLDSSLLSREEQELLMPKVIEGWGSDNREIDGLEDEEVVARYSQRLQQMQIHLLKEITSRKF